MLWILFCGHCSVCNPVCMLISVSKVHLHLCKRAAAHVSVSMHTLLFCFRMRQNNIVCCCRHTCQLWQLTSCNGCHKLMHQLLNAVNDLLPAYTARNKSIRAVWNTILCDKVATAKCSNNLGRSCIMFSPICVHCQTFQMGCQAAGRVSDHIWHLLTWRGQSLQI